MGERTLPSGRPTSTWRFLTGSRIFRCKRFCIGVNGPCCSECSRLFLLYRVYTRDCQPKSNRKLSRGRWKGQSLLFHTVCFEFVNASTSASPFLNHSWLSSISPSASKSFLNCLSIMCSKSFLRTRWVYLVCNCLRCYSLLCVVFGGKWLYLKSRCRCLHAEVKVFETCSFEYVTLWRSMSGLCHLDSRRTCLFEIPSGHCQLLLSLSAYSVVAHYPDGDLPRVCLTHFSAMSGQTYFCEGDRWL